MNEREQPDVSEEELEVQEGELIPDREEMALIQPIEDPGVIWSLPVEPRDGA